MNRKIWIVVSVLVAAGIFYSSSLEGDVSGEASLWLASFVRVFVPDVSYYALGVFHFLVRKGAHFFVYLVLAFCLVQTLKFYVADARRLWFYAWLIASVYGIKDEIHQYFVPGRVMAITDMIINAAGAFAGAAFSVFILFLVANRRG